MLRIHAIQTKEIQKQLCEKCSVEFLPDALAYAAFDTPEIPDDPAGSDIITGELLGITQFSFKKKGVLVYDLCSPEGVDDFEALFIMARSMLNFVDLCGTHDAFLPYPERIEDRLISAVGFKMQEDGTYYMDLRGFFTKHHG